MSPVLVVVTQPAESGLSTADGEALGAGRALASEAGTSLVCAVIGSGVDGAATEAAERGADRVLIADAPHLERFSGDAVLAAAAAAVAECDADTVIVSRGAHTLDIVPRLGARLGGGAVTGVTEFRSGSGDMQVVASAYGGSVRATYRLSDAGPRVVAVAPKFADPPEREAGRAAEVAQLVMDAPAQERVRVVQAAEESGPRLEEARVVVSGGRGLQDGANYSLIRDLAELLGGMPGASRAIVDTAWAAPEQQVGMTGTLVSPDLYIAAGISGASQHMMGCSTARVLVAINSDASAPIFQYAHFGIVDDCLEVLPELIRLRRDA